MKFAPKRTIELYLLILVVCALSALLIQPARQHPPTARAAPAADSNVIEIHITAAADDAEEWIESGAVDLASSDLELSEDTEYSGAQLVGLRFANVPIPPGAFITRAAVDFTVDESDDRPTSVLFHGQAADDAAPFTTATHDISQRPRTGASVLWRDLPTWNDAGQTQRTPDLTPIVQEIVDRPGWQVGNALALLLTGSGKRTAAAFDGSPGGAPRLWIEYSTTPPLSGAAGASEAADGPVNIILLIGDGMGVGQIAAAGMYKNGAPGTLRFESAPQRAMMTTHAADTEVTDSAAAASAMATGRKVNKGTISMAYPGDGAELETLVEHFAARCKSTGLVGTTVVNHATLAAFGAHEPDRSEQARIADDFWRQTQPNVLLGGAGDGISSAAATAAGYHVVRDRESLQAFLHSSQRITATHLSGQFGSDHMAFEADYAGGTTDFYDTQPHLSEMTAAALDVLDDDPNGFFLMVEGSRIDQAAHVNSLAHTVHETLEFERAVQVVLNWAALRTDTLILVTADHETGGLTVVRNLGAGQLPEVTWSTLQHTPDPVPIYAWGPNAERVAGVIDNTDVYRIATAGSGAPRSCELALRGPSLGTHSAPVAAPVSPLATPPATATAPISTPASTPTATATVTTTVTTTVLIIDQSNAHRITTPPP